MITTPTFDDIQNLYSITPVLSKKADELRYQAASLREQAIEFRDMGDYPGSVTLCERVALDREHDADDIDRAIKTIYVLLVEV